MPANNAKTALLCAYTLASARHYPEAEALILSDAELAKTPEAMDLLARIRAEQGDLPEARRLWQEIQALHPEHRPSRQALRHLGKRPHARAGRWLGMAAAALVGLLAGASVAAAVARPPQAEPDLTATWRLPGIPTGQALADIAAHRGRTARVALRSDFFSDPARVAQRAVLVGMVSQAAGISPANVYLSQAPDGAPAGSFTVELYRR